MKISTPRLLTLLTIALSTATQGAVQDSGNRKIEEILVTAQKRTQSYKEVPGAITAISSELLTQSSTTSFEDISKIVPGVFFGSTTGDGLGQSISIRGVASLPYESDIRPGVTFFIDEVPLFRLDSAFSNLSDLERIEVLKGPQSTLYGRAVSAGAISLITKKPELGVVEGSVSLELTDPGGWYTQAAVNIPLGKNLAARVVAYGRDKEGELENILTGDKGTFKNTGGRINLMYQPTHELEFRLGYSAYKTEVRDEVSDRVTYGVKTLGKPDGVVTLPEDPFDGKVESLIPSGRDISFELYSFNVSWDIGEHWRFSSISAFQVYDRQLDKGGILPSTGEQIGGDASFLPYTALPFISFGSPSDEESLSQELRLAYESDKWSSLYGVYYSNTEGEDATSLLAAGGTFPLSIAREVDVTDSAIFTHHTYHHNDQWDFIFGVRYAKSRAEVANQLTFFAGHFGDGTLPVGPTKEASFYNLGGTLSTVYTLSDSVSMYATIAQGFKPGGFNASQGVPDYDPQESINYEAGIKSTLFNNALRLNVSIFQQDYDHFQIEEFNPDSLNGLSDIITNAAEVEVQGIEADFLWLVTGQLKIDGALAYIDSRYGSYEFASCNDEQKLALVGTASGTQLNGCTSIEDSTTSASDGFQDLTDKRLPQVSPWTLNLNAQYDGKLRNGLSWYVRGEIVFKDDLFGFTALDPGSHQTSYELYNASIGLSSATNWEITVFAKNISDEDYVGGHYPGRDGELGIVGIKGAGQTFGVAGKYNL